MTTPAVVETAAAAVADGVVTTPAVVAPITIEDPSPPAVVEPVVAPVVADPASNEPTVVEYAPTGDVGLDVALKFVGGLGIALDHPAMQATENGDFSLIKAHLATIGDKARGWEQMVALAESAYQRDDAKKTAQNAAVTAAVHKAVGGSEQWDAIKAWAGVNATPEERAEVNAMLSGGPVSARAAGQMLLTAYQSDPSVTVRPANALRDPAITPTGVEPLSARDYHAAVNKLAAKIGANNLSNSKEYAALQTRRLAAR